ncbi:MAG: hypothetical protein ACI8RZ_003097 [Myxococcota bacterium]|jgi:hypothetical protein
MAVDAIKVSLKIPYLGGIDGTWRPNDDERRAAWELYVELVTRVAVNELREDEGGLREALSSLHSVFGTTREVLRRYGPSLATPSTPGYYSIGYLAMAVLNFSLRPFLSKWHPLLLDCEARRGEGVSLIENEQSWNLQGELQGELKATREVLTQYADLLAQAAGVPSLIIPRQG